MSRDPYAWVRDKQWVEIRSAQCLDEAGEVIGYQDQPTVIVRLRDGRRITRALHLVYPAERPDRTSSGPDLHEEAN